MTTEGPDEETKKVDSAEKPAARRRTTPRRATASAEAQDAIAKEQATEEPPKARRTSRRRTTAAATEADMPPARPARGRRREAATADAPEAAADTPAEQPARRRRRQAATETVEAADAPAAARPARGRRQAATADAPEAAADTPVEQPARRRRRQAATETVEAADAPAAARPARGRRQAATAEAPEIPRPALQPRPAPRLLEKLRGEVAPVMVQEFGYTTPMQVPRLDKIVLNIGLGEALLNARALENAAGDLTLISGQRPVTTRAKKSIAGFKIRQGMAIGQSVTLRGRRMYEFLDRLISSALPRIRDFRGISRSSFDGRGNFALGIREQVIFPEIDYNSIDRIRGLQVVICTTAPTDAEGLRFLELMGMPFVRVEQATRVA